MAKSQATPASTRGGKIAVVIPCYREIKHILDVLAGIGPEVSVIYVIDDACPDHTGEFVEANATDKRVRVLRNPENLGVGGSKRSEARRLGPRRWPWGEEERGPKAGRRQVGSDES